VPLGNPPEDSEENLHPPSPNLLGRMGEGCRGSHFTGPLLCWQHGLSGVPKKGPIGAWGPDPGGYTNTGFEAYMQGRGEERKEANTLVP
jgi:hypothetical protein